MSVSELESLVPPPANPVDSGPVELRTLVERQLGLTLPQDIVDFGLRYGSGTFADGQFWVFNPFAPWYQKNVAQVCELYQRLKTQEGGSFVPFKVFPQRPGLLPWGSEANGHQMFWLTDGHPDQWATLLFNRDINAFERWMLPATTFISRVLSGALHCNLWTAETQRGLRHVFEPC